MAIFVQVLPNRNRDEFRVICLICFFASILDVIVWSLVLIVRIVSFLSHKTGTWLTMVNQSCLQMTGTIVRAVPLWRELSKSKGDFRSDYYFSSSVRGVVFRQFYLWMLDCLFLPFSFVVLVTIYRAPRMFRLVCS